MTEYKFRLSLLAQEKRYDLTERTLTCSDGSLLDLADIGLIQIYNSYPGGNARGAGSVGWSQCFIRPNGARFTTIVSRHYVRLGTFEDRAETYQPFVDALIAHTAVLNRDTAFVTGMPLALWWLWALALAGLALVGPLFMGLMLIPLLGAGALGIGVLAIAVIAASAIFLVSVVRPLSSSWPRRFDPSLPAA